MGGGKGVSTVAPVVASIRIQSSMAGKPIPLVFGMTRLAGNVLQYEDFRAVPVTTTTGGGKGGGSSSSSTTWWYYATVLLGLCQGPIQGIQTVWRGKEKIQYKTWKPLAGFPPGLTLQQFPMSVTLGTTTQQALADGFAYPGSVSLNIPPGSAPQRAIAYRNLAYMSAYAFSLGTDGGFPQISVEVAGLNMFNSTYNTQTCLWHGIADASIRDVIFALLLDPYYGAAAGLSNLSTTGVSSTQFENYTNAAGLFVSPAYVDQSSVGDMVNKLAMIGNGAIVYSGTTIKLIPYADSAVSGNGYSYTPNNTPVYRLTDDDFLGEGSDPIRVTRGNQSDAYNRVSVKYYNRANGYNEDVVVADDQAAIELYGLRTADPIEVFEVCDTNVARNIAQIKLQRGLYIRNTYEFTLSWRYGLLEPMDIVTLTESSGTEINDLPVRIILIEEDDEGALNITAEDFPGEVSSFVQYETQSGAGYVTNYGADPGNANPLIWEAPEALLTSGLEIWVGASGGENWGGCDVYVSNDGSSYAKLGTISSPIRQGSLTADLPDGDDPDQVNTLSVLMADANSTLAGGSQADVDAFDTLCIIGNELIAYRDSVLTATNTYNLTYLRRGVYNTPSSLHVSGSQFARVDSNAFFKYSFTTDRIGSYVYVKLVSFNVYSAAYQLIEDVEAIPYLITGAAFLSSLPDISNMGINYIANQTNIYWDAVDDFRQPAVNYEVRIGATFESAQIVGYTPLPKYVPSGDGTYWISAHYLSGGVHVYSENPSQIIVYGSTITTNIIATYDEEATGWSGTLSSGLVIDGTEIKLSASGDVLSISDFLIEPDIISYGDLALSGIYTLPGGHAVSLVDVAPCQVLISYVARGESTTEDILIVNDILTIGDFLGAQYGQYVSVTPQIAIADGSGTYGSWQNYSPGVYVAKHFKARVLLSSSNSTVAAVLSDFVFSVDVPDRSESGSLTTATGGTSVSYTIPYNVAPQVQVTISGATAGDEVFLTSETTTGFSVQIKNAGTGVARTINWFAQSY